MNYLRELIHRLRLGQSDRAISRDLHLSRVTVRKYRQLASSQGCLSDSLPLPPAQELTAVPGPTPDSPNVSSALPYQQVVDERFEQG